MDHYEIRGKNIDLIHTLLHLGDAGATPKSGLNKVVAKILFYFYTIESKRTFHSDRTNPKGGISNAGELINGNDPPFMPDL